MTKHIVLEQIDRSTHEGRLLFAALIELTTTVHRDKTPFDVIERLYEIAANTDVGNKDESWPKKAQENIYAQFDRLSSFLLKEMPKAIQEGGAIDNAISLLKKAYSDLDFKHSGGEEIPKGKFCNTLDRPFATAIKNAINMDEQVKQAGLFEIQQAGEVVLRKAIPSLQPDEYTTLEIILVNLYRHYSGQ